VANFPAPKWAQCLAAALVAVAELLLRLAQVVNAPFFALTIIGPAATLTEIWRSSSQIKAAPVSKI
jgi:hypothetical protein